MKEFIKRIDQNPGANVTDLSKKLDITMYPSPGSDIVALMVLGHQTHVHNLIAVATHSVTPGSSPEKIKEHGEPVVRSMLFADAVALTEPVTGTSDYAATFAQQGPRDSRGRSLRDLDLKQRLLRYPLSYLVYSKSFDGMSQPLKDYVYRRFKEILTGADTSKDFAKLSEADRQAILEILKETKPDFAALMK
jgi:hypothetical protein